MNSWNNSLYFCEWKGVSCGHRHRRVTAIDLESSCLVSSLCPYIGNLSFLQKISLSNNTFQRKIPQELSLLSSLQTLNQNNNSLKGEIPANLSHCSSLTFLGWANNNLVGKVPRELSFLSKLKHLATQKNNLTGGIPSFLVNLTALEVISAAQNAFTGSIPDELGQLRNISYFALGENNLSGEVPNSIGNLSLLNELHLDDNRLQGIIPSNIGNCQSLILLNLSQNNFSGTIPKQLFSIFSLSISLNLGQNSLFGSLPSQVGNLKNLAELDISENKLSGEVPSTLGSCTSHQNLSLEGNFLQGSIPSSLSSLRGIQFLDLSRNNLSGRIPEYFAAFNLLQNLNLSYNDFEDAVPTKGIFANASAVSVNGNSKLCGGVPELQLSLCNSIWSKKRRLTLASKLAISICSGLLGVSFMLCILYICWYRKTEKDLSSISLKKSLLKVSYQTLLKATDGFSSGNLIDVGSFGSVYRGILEHDGTIVAVKVLTAGSGVDYQGNDFKALVYDFMVNGSLEDWLHPVMGLDLLHNEPKKLDLHQRLNISIDVACALDYLHHDCQTPIIHCDLKPSNILLNEDMIGHVGDFGLARFLQEANRNFNAKQGSSTGVRGTIGYTAPEYGMGSEVTTKGDVYSYGIVLFKPRA
ncbi:hypothetical protein ACSBR2_007743 [Camellia fascicularis]